MDHCCAVYSDNNAKSYFEVEASQFTHEYTDNVDVWEDNIF